MPGLLIAFEGLDQSGKQTQAERLKAEVEQRGRKTVLLDFPSYETHIGKEIGETLHGGRDYGPDTMQLLYIANRYEKKPEIERLLADGVVVICDRYLAKLRDWMGRGYATSSATCPQRRSRSCSTSRQKPLRAARQRTATSTSAISRCCHACAKATAGRRKRQAGCGSMASARRRRSPQTFRTP